MFHHVLCGIELRSDLPFASLPLAEPGDPEAPSLRLRSAPAGFGEPQRWLYHDRSEESAAPFRAVGVTERGYLVRLFGVADFLLEKGTRSAAVAPAPGAAPDAIEPLFLEQVVPLWASLLGRPCLHASAVLWGEGESLRALAFAGRSGSGKSTLAASLAASSALIADDCLVIEVAGDRVLAHPSHPAVRLRRDSAQALLASPLPGARSISGSIQDEKRRVDMPPAPRAAPLGRVYMLEAAPGPPRAVPLRPRDALARLATSYFRIDPEDRARLAEELDLLDRVVARVPVVALEVPRSYAALADVRATIAADLARE